MCNLGLVWHIAGASYCRQQCHLFRAPLQQQALDMHRVCDLDSLPAAFIVSCHVRCLQAWSSCCICAYHLRPGLPGHQCTDGEAPGSQLGPAAGNRTLPASSMPVLLEAVCSSSRRPAAAEACLLPATTAQQRWQDHASIVHIGARL
jgi:hypothetical protein